MTEQFSNLITETTTLWSFNYQELGFLLLRFIINLAITAGIILYLYYPRTQRRDYFFTFILTSSTIFMLLYLLDTVNIQVGFALGLFAVFGILRYRTDALPIREMTYLFMIIGISVINALGKHFGYLEIIAINSLFIGLTWLMESNRILKHVSYKEVIYERVEMIRPENYNELVADLTIRIGIPIKKIEIGKIDFLRDTALLRVYYASDEVNMADVNHFQKGDDD